MNNTTITLKKIVKDNLLPYQHEHTQNLVEILQKNTTALSTSDTGTGKTYCLVAVCAQLNLTPIIICPKSIISVWHRVSKLFKVKPFFIVNYETIKSGKYYVNGAREKCPYLTVHHYDPKKPEDKEKIRLANSHTEYVWDVDALPKNVVFIFDECHKACDINTLNGSLLYNTKKLDKYVLLASATIAEKPERFRLFFYILNFIDPIQAKAKNLSFTKYMFIMNRWIMRDLKPMYKIYTMLYPDRASRIRIDVLGDMFPESQILAQSFTMGQKREEEIEQEYIKIADEIENLHDKSVKDKGNILVKLMRSHQKIELLKIPTIVELANDFMENGHSVVIFVNFTQTLELLSEMLNTKCIIYGEQTTETRQTNIDSFMNNSSKIIICNIKAGSVGLSLHDIHGGAPRVSLISPTWSAIDLTQALGRVRRAGGKTKSLQRIIYTANTIEEKIADKLQKKLNDLNTLNNGDVDLTNVVFERKRYKKLEAK